MIETMTAIMTIITEFQTVDVKFVKNGPKCYCGNKDWFIGESGARCSDCDRWRDVG